VGHYNRRIVGIPVMVPVVSMKTYTRVCIGRMQVPDSIQQQLSSMDHEASQPLTGYAKYAPAHACTLQVSLTTIHATQTDE
jgi:hypothetical protein